MESLRILEVMRRTLNMPDTCQICRSHDGDVCNIQSGCILRDDIQKTFNVKLKFSISTISMCYDCRYILQLWEIFVSKVQANLAEICCGATGKQKTSVSSEVQKLTEAIHDIIVTADSLLEEDTQTNDANEQLNNSSPGHSSEIVTTASENWVQHTNSYSLRLCEVRLDRNEVESYFRKNVSAMKSQAKTEPLEIDQQYIVEEELDIKTLILDEESSDYRTEVYSSFIDSLENGDRDSVRTCNSEMDFFEGTQKDDADKQINNASLAQSSKIPNTKKETEVHICELCSKRYANRYNLGRHVNKVHGYDKYISSSNSTKMESDSYYCKKCNIIVSIQRRNWHLQSYRHNDFKVVPLKNSEIPNKVYVCSICDKFYKFKLLAAEHLREVHFCNNSKYIKCMTRNEIQNVSTDMKQTQASDGSLIYDLKSPFVRAVFNKKFIPKKYTCNFCHIQFHRKSMLSKHVVEHTLRSEILTCDVCLKQFGYKVNLKKHMRTHLVTQDKLICHSCSNVFPTLELLTSHVLNCSQLWTFHCNFCPKACFTLEMYEKHLENVHGLKYCVPSGPMHCVDCCKTFYGTKSFNVHVRQVHIECFKGLKKSSHDIEIPKLVCNYCKASFWTKNKLYQHKYSLHKVGDFICHKCVSSFKTHKQLMDHYLVHEGQSICCELCNAVVLNKTELRYHVIMEHVVNIHKSNKLEAELSLEAVRSIFLCPSCDLEFPSILNLKSHLYCVHDKETSFKCKVCSSVSKHLCDHIRHVKDIHFLNERYRIRCHYCFNVVPTISQLRKHLGGTLPADFNLSTCYFHEQKAAKVDKSFHYCKFCEKKYKGYTGIRKHYRNHHPEISRHICEICNKKYNFKCHVLRHVAGKHKQLDFSCCVCNGKFDDDQSLQKHAEEKHKGSLSCSQFDMLVTSYKFLTNHIERHKHVTVRKTFQTMSTTSNSPLDNSCESVTFSCKYCNRVSLSFKTAWTHLCKYHREKLILKKNLAPSFVGMHPDSNFSCDICFSKFGSTDALVRHKANHESGIICSNCGHVHPRISLEICAKRCQYSCPKCPLKQKNLFALQNHSFNHASDCSHCHSKVSTVTKIIKHYEVYHPNMLPFPLFCVVCSYNCGSYDELTAHLKGHERNLVHCNACRRDVCLSSYKVSHSFVCKSKTRCCDICREENFNNHIDYLKHVNEHGISQDFKCSLCHSFFSSELNLQMHTKNNHGSYTCHFCNLNMNYKYDVELHMKFHMKIKELKCSFCQKIYNDIESLYTHVLADHKSKIPNNVLKALDV